MADRSALVAELLGDLAAECAALDAVVAGLEDTAWRGATPAEGWTVAHQIAHLAWTDEQALRAATDPEGFAAGRRRGGTALGTRVDDAAATAGGAGARAAAGRAGGPGRTALAEALAALPDGTQLPWFGPPMSAASMATARLMETWAHGLDVTDALRPAAVGVRRGCGTSRTSASAPGTSPSPSTGCPSPAEPFRVELAAPDGGTWSWGPEDAAQRVTGPALDFCLRVTQRRHRADLALAADGGRRRPLAGPRPGLRRPAGRGGAWPPAPSDGPRRSARPGCPVPRLGALRRVLGVRRPAAGVVVPGLPALGGLGRVGGRSGSVMAVRLRWSRCAVPVPAGRRRKPSADVDRVPAPAAAARGRRRRRAGRPGRPARWWTAPRRPPRSRTASGRSAPAGQRLGERTAEAVAGAGGVHRDHRRRRLEQRGGAVGRHHQRAAGAERDHTTGHDGDRAGERHQLGGRPLARRRRRPAARARARWGPARRPGRAARPAAAAAAPG